MRIAVIAADLIPQRLGGAEQHVVEVIKILAKKKGFYFHLFVGPDPRISEIFPKSVKVHRVSYPKLPNLYGLSYIVFAPFQIIFKLSRLKPDIIWAKQVFPQAVVGAVVAGTLKKPLYITAQNPRMHHEELIVRGRLLKPLHKFFAALLDPMISWALKNTRLVAAVSRYSAGLAEEMGAQRVVVIPNGVDLERFRQRKRQKSKIFNIVTTSALIPRNGIDTLIEAVSLLPENSDWQLLIAGEGPEEKKLKSQISNLSVGKADLKLQRRIKLLGRLPNDKIPELLSEADVFVRPSRWEGFGVAFLEAMAAGVPVIATPIGGIPDFIADRKTGLLVEPDNPQELVAAIKLLWKDEKLEEKLTRNANLMLKKQYTWGKIADGVDKAFKTIS